MDTPINSAALSNVCLFSDGWARGMLTDCASAKKSIAICAMSLMIPYRSNEGQWSRLFASWLAARARGVDVSIMLSAPHDSVQATRANASALGRLANAGIRVHLIKGARLLHSKACVIDAQIAWIGSGNFTLAACESNHELYVRADCAHLAAQLENTIKAYI